MGERKQNEDHVQQQSKHPGRKPSTKGLEFDDSEAMSVMPAPDENLSVAPANLRFSAVVGRPTLAEEVLVTNLGSDILDLHLRIEAANDSQSFILESEHTEFVDPATTNPQPKGVRVRYAPTKPGTESGTLVIATKHGENRIALHGAASQLVDAPRLTDGQVPEPVRTLPDVGAEKDPRALISRAMEAVSALPHSFETTAPGMDAVSEAFADTIVDAGEDLTSKVIKWLRDEGVAETRAANRHATGMDGVVRDFFLKGVEKGLEEAFDLGGPELAGIMFAIEIGSTAQEALAANSEADERVSKFTEHVEPAFKIANKGLGAASSELMRRYGALLTAYAARRAEVKRIAATESMMALSELQHAQSVDAVNAYETAQSVLDDYKASQKAWGATLAKLADTATRAPAAVVKGFHTMLDEYLDFRVEKAREEAVPERMLGISRKDLQDENPYLRPESGRCLEVVGGINLSEPADVQFSGTYETGDYQDPSETMRERLEQRPIGSFAAWTINVRLAVAQGGEVVVHRTPEGTWTVTASGDGSDAIRRIGRDRLISIVSTSTLSMHVVKVPS